MYVATFVGRPRMSLLRGNVDRAGGAAWFRADQLDLPLGSASQVGLSSTMPGTGIVLGVRAEDVRVHASNEASPGSTDSTLVPATVVLLEPMGSDTFVELQIGDQAIVARVAPQNGLTLGQRVWAELAIGRCHFFDAASEDRLGP